MGVPPSCHVHLPMSLLWLRWRWQEQSGARQSNRKKLARSHPGSPSLSLALSQSHTHSHKHTGILQEKQTLSLSAPRGVCQLSLTSSTSREVGSFPSLPLPHTGDSLGVACWERRPLCCALLSCKIQRAGGQNNTSNSQRQHISLQVCTQ